MKTGLLLLDELSIRSYLFEDSDSDSDESDSSKSVEVEEEWTKNISVLPLLSMEL